MKRPTFAERLAYARWLFHFKTGVCVSNVQIADAVDRTPPWVTKWAASKTPPRDYEVHRPLADFLGVPEVWLIRDEQDAPEAELWVAWLSRAADRDDYANSDESKPAARRRPPIKQIDPSMFKPAPRSKPKRA